VDFHAPATGDRQRQMTKNGGALVQVLEDWCPPFSGYHLYYPGRRRPSQAFSLVVDALRSEGKR